MKKKKGRGRGPAAEEESEQKRHERRQRRLKKEEERKEEKQERTKRRLQRFMLSLGHDYSTIEVEVKAHLQSGRPPSISATADIVDTSVVPLGTHIPLPPMPVPFDAWSFDGRFGISVLCTNTGRRDVPTLCRFNYCPREDAAQLLGDAGLADPAESYLYPSVCAAAKRANQGKAANGWTFFYVFVIHNDRTSVSTITPHIIPPHHARQSIVCQSIVHRYRVPLLRFREDMSAGPGFVQRGGLQYTQVEIERMCRLASQVHPSTKVYARDKYCEIVHSMGKHRPRDHVPGILEPILRALPNLITPRPTAPVTQGKWRLPPVTRDFCPTFVTFTT